MVVVERALVMVPPVAEEAPFKQVTAPMQLLPVVVVAARPVKQVPYTGGMVAVAAQQPVEMVPMAPVAIVLMKGVEVALSPPVGQVVYRALRLITKHFRETPAHNIKEEM